MVGGPLASQAGGAPPPEQQDQALRSCCPWPALGVGNGSSAENPPLNADQGRSFATPRTGAAEVPAVGGGRAPGLAFVWLPRWSLARREKALV